MTTLTAEHMNYRQEVKQKTAIPLILIALVSIVMLFVGLTSAVIVVKPDGRWVSFDMPSMFLYSTIIIVASSVLFQVGLLAVKRDKLGVSKLAFLGTFVLAIAFSVSQYYAWGELYAEGIVFSGSNLAGSFFYVLTGLHLAHVVGGIISLIVVLIKSFRGKYNSNNFLGVQVSIIYWHFLGALWIYLFFFLRFIA